MSHFTVLVALDKSVDLSTDDEGNRPGLQFALDQVLERYSEGREVEPYRSYLDGGPEDFWWVQAARRHRDEHAAGEGLKPYDPGTIGWSTASSGKTLEEQRAEQALWIPWAEQLDALEEAFGALRWIDVIKKYDAWKLRTGDHSDDVFIDEDRQRAYTIETYNQDSRWDWWQIGGRWAGRFHVKEPFETEDVLFAKFGRWDSPNVDDPDGRIDGGRVRYVDLERRRQEEVDRAVRMHTIYHELRKQHGEGFREWSHFTALVDDEQLTIQEARKLYHDQPFYQALVKSDEFDVFFSDVHAEMNLPLEEIIVTARNGAVTCYSFVDKRGKWWEPGRMGWFGMSDDTAESRAAYDVEVNAYLSTLDPDDILVVLDCHI